MKADKSIGKYNIVSDRRGGQTTLSRRIVEDLLGIELPEYIVVHHMDMNRSNNDIDNLMLMSNEEHCKFHARKAEQVSCICHNCNKVFNLNLSEYKYRKKVSDKLYCSRSCAGSGKKPPINHTNIYPDNMNELIITDWKNDLGVTEISRKHNWPSSAVGYRISRLKADNIIIDKPKKTIKLNKDKVIDIYLSTDTIKSLSLYYNVSTETIRAIKQKRSHKDVTKLL